MQFIKNNITTITITFFILLCIGSLFIIKGEDNRPIVNINLLTFKDLVIENDSLLYYIETGESFAKSMQGKSYILGDWDCFDFIYDLYTKKFHILIPSSVNVSTDVFYYWLSSREELLRNQLTPLDLICFWNTGWTGSKGRHPNHLGFIVLDDFFWHNSSGNNNQGVVKRPLNNYWEPKLDGKNWITIHRIENSRKVKIIFQNNGF